MGAGSSAEIFNRAWRWALVICVAAGTVCGFALGLRAYGEDTSDDLIPIDPGATLAIFTVGGAFGGLVAGCVLGAMVAAAIAPEIRNRLERATTPTQAKRSVAAVFWAVLGTFAGIAVVLSFVLGPDATPAGRLTAVAGTAGAVIGAAFALILLQEAAAPFAPPTASPAPGARRSRPLRADRTR